MLEPDSREYWKEQADYWLARFLELHTNYMKMQMDYYAVAPYKQAFHDLQAKESVDVYEVFTEDHHECSDLKYVFHTFDGAKEKALQLAGILDPSLAIWQHTSDGSGEWWSILLSSSAKVVVHKLEVIQ